MITEVPARIMGVYSKKGTLAKDADADIVAFDADINIKKVFAHGEVAFE